MNYFRIVFFLLASVSAALFAQSAPTKAPTTDGEQINKIIAYINTDKGKLIVELFPEEAPQAVSNFIKLSIDHYYDGLTFHRVVKDFAQTGDPTGTGSGNPGYLFADEINADSLGLDKLLVKDAPEYNQYADRLASALASVKLGIKDKEEWKARESELKTEYEKIYKRIQLLSVKEMLEGIGYKFTTEVKSHPVSRGTVVMANSGRPNTNGSQFFITKTDILSLNGLHTVFGRLIEGYDVLDAIIAAGSKNSKIISVEIKEMKPEAP